MLKNFKNFIKKYYLVILGAILFFSYFWNRFLTTRVPKILPLNISVFGFFVLLYICLIFLYIVISLLFPRKQNDIINELINWFFTPLIEFDKYLKSLPFIKNNYEKFLFYILPKLDFLIIKTNLFYTIFWILPRLILLFAFIIDIFIFYKFHYKYMVILFGLLLFFNRYFKHSLKTTKQELIIYYSQYIDGIGTDYYPGIHPCEFEPDYDPQEEENDPSEYMFLPLDIFIEFYVESKIQRNVIIYMYPPQSTWKARTEFWKKYIKEDKPDYHTKKDIPSNYTNIFGNDVPDNYYKARYLVFNKLEKFKTEGVEKIIQISLILRYYNHTSNENKTIKKAKVAIYSAYFVCWSYVLYISFYTLDLLDLVIMLNETWLNIKNPFI